MLNTGILKSPMNWFLVAFIIFLVNFALSAYLVKE